jgi:hypothetical protein
MQSSRRRIILLLVLAAAPARRAAATDHAWTNPGGGSFQRGVTYGLNGLVVGDSAVNAGREHPRFPGAADQLGARVPVRDVREMRAKR